MVNDPLRLRPSSLGRPERRGSNPPHREDEVKEEKRPSRALAEGRSFLFDMMGAVIVLLIVIGSLYTYTGNWPPLVVVQSGSMQHDDSSSSVGVIDTGDLVFVKTLGKRDSIRTYVEGLDSGYRTYGSYGDVVIYRPNGNRSKTAIIHRAVVYLEWNDTTYNLPAPLFKLGEEARPFLKEGPLAWNMSEMLNTGLISVMDDKIGDVLSQFPDIENVSILRDTMAGVEDRTVRDLTWSYRFPEGLPVVELDDHSWSIEDGSREYLIREVDGTLMVFGFFRMGGSYDISSIGIYGLDGVYTIQDYEWPKDLGPKIDLKLNTTFLLEKYREKWMEPHSGYITKGDDNDQADQFTHFNDHGWIEPVKRDWLVGKSVGEIPWFGIIKLKMEGKENAPSNSETNLIIALVVLVATPFLVDLIIHLIVRARRKREEVPDVEEDTPIRPGYRVVSGREGKRLPPRGHPPPDLKRIPPPRRRY